MTPPHLSTSSRLELIRNSIERVKRSEDHFRQVSADPSASTLRIDGARATHAATVAEFGWQWKNVEAVLDALAPEEK